MKKVLFIILITLYCVLWIGTFYALFLAATGIEEGNINKVLLGTFSFLVGYCLCGMFHIERD